MKHRYLRSLFGVTALACCVLAFPTAATADLITLSIPGIPGDSLVKGQEKTIEVMSLSANAKTMPVVGKGQPPSAVPLTADPLKVIKRFDNSSPALFLALATGKVFLSGVVITFFTDDPTRGGLIKVFTITLGTVIISSMSVADDSGPEAGAETVELTYGQIQLKDEASQQQSCWDLIRNAQCSNI
jgi:type VI secretion system Hcp family effector